MQYFIEHHRAFPFIAWAAFVVFALFVGHLAINLENTSSDLAKQTMKNVRALKNTP